MRVIALWALLSACVACSVVPRGTDLSPQPEVIALTNVTVIDVRRGEALSDQNVLVTGNRIAAVGPSQVLGVPRGATIVDARGKYLIPGLWDMHVHLGSTGRSSLAVYVANGLTGVRDMGEQFAQVQAWRDSIRSEALLGPRILLAGPIVENAAWLANVRRAARARGDTTPEALFSDRIAVATSEDARRAVDSVAALGADFLKLRTDPPPEALAELIRVARERGLPVAAHVPLPVTAERLAQLKFASIEHGYIGVIGGRITSALEGLTYSERLAVFQALAARDVAYTPTLITHKASRLMPDSLIRAVALDQAGQLDPRRAYVERELTNRWLRDLAGRQGETPIDWSGLYKTWVRDVGTANEAGVLLLAGSDPGTPMVFPGFALHEELATLVDDGELTPTEALRTATLNPAKFMGADSLGVVEPGRLADLVLLDANPLTNIRNTSRIRAVVLNGRYFDRAALDGLLAEARKAVGLQP